MARSGCPCHGDLRQRLRDTRRGDLVVAWTPSWAPGRPWDGVHVVFSHEAPTEARAGLGWTVCACEPGSTRLGRGWAVVYGKTSDLVEGLASVPEPNVLVLLFPGEDPAEAIAVVESVRAAGDERPIMLMNIDEPAKMRLRRDGAPPVPA